MDWTHAINGPQIVATILYAIIGMVIFTAGFVIISRILPFSVRKEIEEDQNTALGIILGAIVIGLSIIIAAAIT